MNPEVAPAATPLETRLERLQAAGAPHRFQAGNQIGAIRKRTAHAVARKELNRVAQPERVRAILERLFAAAEDGDMDAIRLVLDKILPRMPDGLPLSAVQINVSYQQYQPPTDD